MGHVMFIQGLLVGALTATAITLSIGKEKPFLFLLFLYTNIRPFLAHPCKRVRINSRQCSYFEPQEGGVIIRRSGGGRGVHFMD